MAAGTKKEKTGGTFFSPSFQFSLRERGTFFPFSSLFFGDSCAQWKKEVEKEEEAHQIATAAVFFFGSYS